METRFSKKIYNCSTGLDASMICITDLFISAGISEGYIKERPINNYICFDELENGECNNDDLYRIIGIFPTNEKKDEYEIKVIKDTPGTKEQIGEKAAFYNCVDDWCNGEFYQNKYYWNSTKGTSYGSANTNNWRESNLNTENLNGYFWNEYLEENNPTLKNMIANHKWIVGGYRNREKLDKKEIYESELGKNKVKIGESVCYDINNIDEARVCTKDDIEYQDEIGLMYVSDYLYATSPELWNITYNGGFFDSWLYSGYNEWTITRNINKIDSSFSSYMIGATIRDDIGTNFNEIVSSSYFTENYIASIRPSFYLKSSIKLASGDGSKESPYRVKL